MGKYIMWSIVALIVGGLTYAIATGNMGGARKATQNYVKVIGG